MEAAALMLAWAVDARWGEPRNALHPVAWLGRLLGPLGRMLCKLPAPLALLGGALLWCAWAGLLRILAVSLEQGLAGLAVQGGLASGLAVALTALLIKPCFAWRMLRDEVQAVEAALAQSLEAGRARVAWLVSRDVSQMDAAQVREAAIETLAENLNDSVVAPLFWWAVAGLPGALLYRFANTADAMWGYRGRYEWAGKWAARADDVLSWLPARLTALLLWRSAAPAGWAALRREAARTPSPNGGWPMGAMALQLGVALRKPGVYALNPLARPPGPADTEAALRRAHGAALLALGLALLAGLLRGWAA